MKDLSRERLQRLRELSTKYKFGEWELDPDEFRALLDMASRAVSEETVRKLAEYVAIAADPTNAREKERTWAWTAFSHEAFSDLRPSAEALARSAGEGQP